MLRAFGVAQLLQPDEEIGELIGIVAPHLFAPWFKNREHWAAWFAFLAALFAIEMTEEQASVYRACTGREALPTTAATDAVHDV